ncbi:BON domain-containing protein [Methylophaga sulfidovorans]|uniref:Osmotically-inducible protein OsmY, contains BON domain n=1 Tax=Methylophaga sulfidovorans TaxID=45496 RepID=A0A1I3YGF3_9GAMM|nr:BON domain-containing protein [Methylophaga sulfidovorans]SFK30875.1 Osmotically-inducible protein OsmY, contains BON domain [Methylophaga sulfidovorans]
MLNIKKAAWLGLVIPAATLFLQACVPVVATGAATGASVAYDRRTTGSVIDDQGIEFKASYAIYNNKEIYNQSHINVTSYNGVVLLTGETPSESLKQKVTAEVKAIPKVRRIYNELAIAAPSALPSRSSDAWITSKIKAKMTTDENTDPFHVKVVTERGVVYLMGMVSHAEAEQAVNIVRNSAGVQRVVKVFEYTD